MQNKSHNKPKSQSNTKSINNKNPNAGKVSMKQPQKSKSNEIDNPLADAVANLSFIVKEAAAQITITRLQKVKGFNDKVQHIADTSSKPITIVFSLKDLDMVPFLTRFVDAEIKKTKDFNTLESEVHTHSLESKILRWAEQKQFKAKLNVKHLKLSKIVNDKSAPKEVAKTASKTESEKLPGNSNVALKATSIPVQPKIG